MSIKAFLIITVLFAVYAALSQSILSNVDPVTELNVPAYLGYWYQMYADKFVINTFEKNSFCDTALYGANKDGTISVHNYATIGAANGTKYTIDGYAYVPDASAPGKLKVHFNSGGAPFDAAYWILEVGPIVNGKYEWAVVSDNLATSLFILARDVTTFQSKYQSSVLAEVERLGFTGFKAPIPIYQGTQCVYDH